MALTDLLARTFWHPFTDPRRATILIGSYFGLLGFTMMNFISSYDLAGQGAAALTTFLSLQFGGLAVLSVGFYFGFSRLDSTTWRAGLLVAAIAIFGLFAGLDGDSVWRGITASVLSAIYWGSVHVTMTHNTTDDNRGHEVALLGVMSVLGMVSASVLSAHFLNAGAWAGIIIAMVALLLGIFCMLVTAHRQPRLSWVAYIGELKRIPRDHGRFIRSIIGRSLFESAGQLMLALMSLLQFPPAMAATLMICRVVIEFTLAPYIGKLSHKLSRNGYRAGLLLIFTGWTGLTLAGHHPLAFLIAILILGVGNRIMGASLTVDMYALKSYAAMTWLETVLGLSRLVAIFALIPLLYLNPAYFTGAYSLLAIAMLVVSFASQKPDSQHA